VARYANNCRTSTAGGAIFARQSTRCSAPSRKLLAAPRASPGGWSILFSAPRCGPRAVTGLRRRLLVFGLDGVPPGFLFDRMLPSMPNVQRLLARARFGTLRTCDPPTSVPAWTVMFTGMDPGSLGFYGYRQRKPGSYDKLFIPTPQMIPVPAIWNILSQLGYRVAVIGVPPGYPPPHVNGVYVSDFMTPSQATDFASPRAIVPEIQRVADGYRFDVAFRSEDRRTVAKEIFAMTRKRFRVARHLWAKEPWDLFVLHEVGSDRIHHAFWKYFDPAHPRYMKDPEFADIAERYYGLLDEEIGEFLQQVPSETAILFVSDHGCQAMAGCFCINEWLRTHGYLALKGTPPSPGSSFEDCAVDWTKTLAWGAGGYFARVFFNIRGREPQGVVRPEDVGPLAQRLTDELATVRRPDGQPLGITAIEPARSYRELRGDPPDLILYFGDLRYRSAGTLGYGTCFLEENDQGADDAVHSFDGVFALIEPTFDRPLHLPDQSILDVAPTILRVMGITPPPTMQGQPIPGLLS
jgi:predicted AlkP superfamily phosphohydrolase/phosphomutase